MIILSKHDLSLAVQHLKQGKTIVFPTETSYGLGCDACNQAAVDRIFRIKGRSKRKPLMAVVPTVAMAKKFLVWNDLLDELAAKYWPGKLTVVDRAKGQLVKGVIAPDRTVALRVTSHPVAGFLSQRLGRPLVATSANLSGQGDVYNAEEIKQIFSRQEIQPDVLLDYGRLPVCKPSTIVSVAGNKLKILRQGDIQLF